MQSTEKKPPCRFCGAEVTSTAAEVDFCRACFYGGRHYHDRFATLIAAFAEAHPAAVDVGVWHTGGGCFAIGIEVANGNHVLLTAADDAVLPEKESDPWTVGAYLSETSEPLHFEVHVDRADLMRVVAEQVRRCEVGHA